MVGFPLGDEVGVRVLLPEGLDDRPDIDVRRHVRDDPTPTVVSDDRSSDRTDVGQRRRHGGLRDDEFEETAVASLADRAGLDHVRRLSRECEYLLRRRAADGEKLQQSLVRPADKVLERDATSFASGQVDEETIAVAHHEL